jgi:hypothetical protein
MRPQQWLLKPKREPRMALLKTRRTLQYVEGAF